MIVKSRQNRIVLVTRPGNKKAVPRQRVQGQEEPKKKAAPTVEAKSTKDKPAVKSEPVSQPVKAATNGGAAKPPVKTASRSVWS